MSDIPATVVAALNSILTPENCVNSQLSTALMSLGTAIDKLHIQQDKMEREVELVRRMSRTNWMMVINLPLPFGVTKSQALKNLFNQLEYTKPLFDSERDLLACDILYVNKGGLLCNMTFFVAQRHYEFLMSAIFQRRIVAYNQKLPKEQWISVGRVLTPTERSDYEVACCVKRLIIAEMHRRHIQDPKFPVQFILVDKRTLRLRIDKEYYTVDDAAVKFSISTEAIAEEKKKAESTHRDFSKFVSYFNYTIRLPIVCAQIDNKHNAQESSFSMMTVAH